MSFFKDIEKRNKTYAYILLGCIVAITIIGLASIWQIAPDNSLFYKIIISLISIGSLSGFLYTLNTEADKLVSQRISKIIGVCAIGLTIIVIGQVWTDFLSNLLFGKIVISLVVIALLGGFIIAVFDDFFENKDLKDKNYLD